MYLCYAQMLHKYMDMIFFLKKFGMNVFYTPSTRRFGMPNPGDNKMFNLVLLRGLTRLS